MKIVKHITGTTAQWAANDIVPRRGELCVEETTVGDIKIKIGNGSSKYSVLKYIGVGVKETGSATLASASWNTSAKTYALTLSSLGADDIVLFTPASRADKTALDSANCVVTVSGSVVTFAATTVPTANIALNYSIIGG